MRAYIGGDKRREGESKELQLVVLFEMTFDRGVPMNPIDWMAFLYGRYFQHHPYVGGGLVVIVCGAFGLGLWLQGVEKYDAEHHKQQEAVQPTKFPPVQDTPPPKEEKKPEVQEPRMEKIPRTSKPRAVSQNAPGGINIGGNNFGTATVTNNYGTAPAKPLELEDAQTAAIVEHLRPFSGQSVEIFLVGDRTQTQRFGSKLREALGAGGLNATLSTAGMLIRSNGAPPPPGISVSVGEARLATADALGTILRRQGVIDAPLGGIRATTPEEFTIYLAPPK